MNFSFLFGIISSLNFTIEFQIGQNYSNLFIFNGSNSSAHLLSKNGSVYLYLSENSVLNIWKASTTDTATIEFTWPNYVNGKKMELQTGNEVVTPDNFEQYVFLSPFLIKEAEIECLCTGCKKTKYHLIYGLIIACLIVSNLAACSYQRRMWLGLLRSASG